MLILRPEPNDAYIRESDFAAGMAPQLGNSLDKYQMLNILMNLKTVHVNSSTIVRDYAGVLAEISGSLSDDEFRRLLFLSAYLCQRVDQMPAPTPATENPIVAWRGNIRLS